jgi:molecular chaperone GrpE (heat shock protein)
LEPLWIEAFDREIEVSRAYAAANPLTNPEAPADSDTCLRLTLQHPDWGPRQILAKMKEMQTRVTIHVFRLLRQNRMLKVDGREEAVRDLRNVLEWLLVMLEERDHSAVETAYRDLDAYLWNRRINRPVVGRLALLELSDRLATLSTRDPRHQLGLRLRETLNLMLPLDSLKLLRRAVRRLAEKLGVRQAPSIDDNFSDIIRTLEEATEDASADDDAETLREQVVDLRAALFGVGQDLADLKERLRKAQESAKADAVVMLLGDMNSLTYGYLLDSVVQSGQLVEEKLANGWRPEPDFEMVPHTLRTLTKYFEQLGVFPMYTIGERHKITFDDLAHIDYMGSEFESPEDVKWVQFRTCGWKYKDKVISRPQALEANQDDAD